MGVIADRVFCNAKVYSVSLDNVLTRAEAVAIKDGKIAYVGDDEGVKEFIGADTEVTDCGGNMILPGFGDAHMHFGYSPKKFAVADIANIADYANDTPDDVVKKIQKVVKDFADAHPDSAVIHGIGWDRSWFAGALQGITRPFTRHDLDAVVPDRPAVLISFCAHVMLLNTKAIEAAGLSADTPEPENGTIRREADGYPDGYVQEPAAMAPICERIPGYEFSEQEVKEALLKCQEEVFFKHGTMLGADMMDDDPMVYTYISDLAKEGKLKARINGVCTIHEADWEEAYAKAKANWGQYDVEDVFKVDTIKYFVDGDPAMLEPYPDAFCQSMGYESGYKGPLLWDKDELKKSFETVQKDGMNIHVHAMGDYGAQVTIDGLISAQEKYNKEGKLRNAIAHVSYITEEDKKRMGDNNIIASNQPYWMASCWAEYPGGFELYGEERCRTSYPGQSLIDAGIRCAFGSDFPVDAPNPFRAMQIGITRKDTPVDPGYELVKEGIVMKPDEKMTLQEMVQGFTINTAYQWHLDDVTGSIEVGKSADMVLIDRDLETTPVEEYYLTEVKETVLRGETVYKA